MSLVTGHNIGLSHGAFDVFSGLSFSIPNNARIGLVGPNGIGKTSLLRIIAGISPPSSGSIHRARGYRLGYLRQEAQEVLAGRPHTIYQEMLTVFDGLRAQERHLRELEARMAAGDASEELLAAYGAAQERFERDGGYDYEVRIGQVLEGLGFGRTQWETPLSHLSGGQKTRLLLARLLLETPDLLILDEPTNHLDVQTVQWLENRLRTWPGALLVVSHDRYFLDRVVDYVWDMSRTAIDVYRGNYSAFVQQRNERHERALQVFADEKERLEKELDYIRRNIAGQRTDMAKGKLKRLTRELLAIEQLGFENVIGKSWSELGVVGSTHMMGVDEVARRIKELQPPVQRAPRLAMRLPSAGRSGDIVLRTENLQIGYPGTPLFRAADILLRRGECAALIGPNGAGKTTFLRTLLEQIPPLSGRVRLGAGLKIGYFAQAHEHMNAEQTVLDELMAHRKGLTIPEARDHLARYLFRGDDIWKKVGMLSGGERGRLALAILALEHTNLLLLDEPTNHLDIPAQEILQEGLERFEGTLLLVSHDRYLVDRLATQIWEIRDGALWVFKGTYQEFVAASEQDAQERKEVAARERTVESATAGTARRAQPGERKRAALIAQLESRIAEAEADLERYARELQAAAEAQQIDEMRRLADAHSATQAELDHLIAEWAELADSPAGMETAS